MYYFDSRIRYSETDSEGRLSLNALLDYFQDCSTFQSEDLGVGLEPLKARNLVWVLSYWQIVVENYPALSEHVSVGTFPYGFLGCMGNRNFCMKDAEGTFLAKADSLWTLIDAKDGKLVKVPADIQEKYVLEEKLDMPYKARKIRVPKDGSYQEDIVVKPYHLDANHHVNNGQYVRMAAAFLPTDFAIGEMRAEYKKQAYLGDILCPFMTEDKTDEGHVICISLRDTEGNVYVNVEFTKRSTE